MAKSCVFLLAAFLVCLTGAQVLLSPPSRACRELGFVQMEDDDEMPLPEYTAGQVMRLRAELGGQMEGVFQFYLCPGVEKGRQECLVRVPLEIGGSSGTVFNLSVVPKPGRYTIPVHLPDDVTCHHCTLMWEVVREDCEGKMEGTCLFSRTTTCVDVTVTSDSEEDLSELQYLDVLNIRR